MDRRTDAVTVSFRPPGFLGCGGCTILLGAAALGFSLYLLVGSSGLATVGSTMVLVAAGAAIIVAGVERSIRSWAVSRYPDRWVVRRRGVLIRNRVRELPAAQVSSVSVEKAEWLLNDDTVYLLNIVFKDGKREKLAESLIQSELDWIASLFRPPPKPRVDDAAGQPPETGTGQCLVCGGGLVKDIVLCDHCRTPHHRECWYYNGKCAVFGCRSISFAKREAKG